MKTTGKTKQDLAEKISELKNIQKAKSEEMRILKRENELLLTIQYDLEDILSNVVEEK